MTLDERKAALDAQMMDLRRRLIEKMKTSPTLADSETLRKLDADILFWSNQTDASVGGLMKTLELSMSDARYS